MTVRMRRAEAGRFAAFWEGERKRRVNLALTARAWHLLDAAARHQGLSRSELVERYARSLESEPVRPPDGAALLDNAPDVIMRCDRRLRYVYVNRAVERAVGVSAAQFIGHSLAEMGSPEELCRRWEATMREVFETGEERIIEFEADSLAGVRFYQSRVVPEFCGELTPKYVLIVARDITEKRRLQEELERRVEEQTRALRESEERFRIAAEHASDLIYEWDRVGRRLQWFGDIAGKLGYAPDQLPPTFEQWLSLIHPDDLDRVQRAAEHHLRTREPFAVEYRVRRADGTYVEWFDRGTALWNEAGEPCRWIGAGSDVSALKAAEARERAARCEAEEANRVKDEFLAVLSHELRTPLNPIIGYSQLLRRGRLSGAEAERALETIERAGKLQNQLISDLLDISRIMQGKLTVERRPIALRPVVEAAIEAVRMSAESQGLILCFEGVADACPIVGDPTRLQQVVWNLLSNAIKFTPAGGKVTVALKPALAGFEICVRDTGQGIAADFLPHVFERFLQADGSSTRRQGGLGLGLAIVRHIVEAHGGTVQAASPGEGRGATFTVWLPAPDGSGIFFPAAHAPRE